MTDRMSRKAFNPIAVDLDEQLDDLARRKGIPTLVDPEPIQPGERPQGVASSTAPETQPAAAADARGGIHADEAPGPQSEHVYLKIKAPLYLSDELHAKARHLRTSVNHLILSTLQSQGFSVKAEDLVPDGRRLRGSRRS